MTSDRDGIHVYGTPDADNPPPPAEGGLRGEKSGEQATPDDGETAGTPGGQPVEDVDDRPNVGTVKPEDYPAEERAASGGG